MEPFYFGPPAARRFAVLHPSPNGSPARGVVLCSPLGHEYVRAHRAFRNLGAALARAGLPALRFDYLGSGDSAESDTPIGVDSWLADVTMAIGELQARTGVQQISLVGLRFGAALAVLASAGRRDVTSIVLWDPVLSGAVYVDELEALQRRWLRDRLGAAEEHMLDGAPELMGMAVDAPLLNGIRRVDLMQGPWPAAERAYVVVSAPRDDCAAYQRALTAHGVPSGIACVPSAGDWQDADHVHQLLLPHEILKQVAALAGA